MSCGLQQYDSQVARMATKLVVGLGQGLLLRQCRHAVGAQLVTKIAADAQLKWQLFPLLAAYVAVYQRAADSGTTILLFPCVPYNITGVVCGAAVRRFGVRPSDVTLIHDDLDVKVGAVKWRHQGSSGGNGVRSCIQSLGSDCFSRVRIGIGRPTTNERRAIVSYVLGDIPSDDMEKIQRAFAHAGIAQILLDNHEPHRVGKQPSAMCTTRIPSVPWYTCALEMLLAHIASVQVLVRLLMGRL